MIKDIVEALAPFIGDTISGVYLILMTVATVLLLRMLLREKEAHRTTIESAHLREMETIKECMETASEWNRVLDKVLENLSGSARGSA